MSQLPSKDEIRQKYGITEKDFEILTISELPLSPQMQQEGVSMKKLGWWGHLEVWAKTTILGGVVLAICFIGSFRDGVETIAKYGPIVWVDGTYIASYVNHYAEHATEQAKGFLAHTSIPPTPEDKLHADMVIFSTGSQIFPLSGSWHSR